MAVPTILHVIPSLATGGAEQMLVSLVTAKRPLPPVAVEVAVLRGGGDLTKSLGSAGIPVHDLGMKHWAELPVALFRLVALIRRVRPVAIQSWLYYADLISLWALEISGRRAKTRLYWGVRCSDMDQSKYRSGLRWAIAACASRSARPDAVIANSFAGRDAHIRLGYAPRAFPVVANGIDTHKFKPDVEMRARIRRELGLLDTELLVIHVARVDPMKDHDSLLKTAAQLPEFRFLAVGRGTESLSGPSNLMVIGQRGDLPALYAAADFAISTSAFGEGFPNVIAEAMAAGLPVVATDVGDSRLIVGDAGLYVPPRDAHAMVAAVRVLACEPEEERRRRGARCRARIKEFFSLDRAVEAFDALHLDGDWKVGNTLEPLVPPAV